MYFKLVCSLLTFVPLFQPAEQEVANTIELNVTFKAKNFSHDRFQLTPNGTFLINDFKEFLYDIDPYGNQINKIDLGSSRMASFAMVPQFGGMYVICALDKTNPKAQSYEILFYDSEGRPAGKGNYFSDGTMVLPNYFRQLFVVGDRLFINRWQPDFPKKRNPPMLQEVTLKKVAKDRFLFTDKGEPFERLMEESTNFATQFKMRWLVKVEGDTEFLVLDQLQPRIWHFEDRGYRGFQRGRHTSLYFADRVLPERFYDEHDFPFRTKVDPGSVPDQEKIGIWIDSFSQVTGFFNYGFDGFLVGYTVPNPAFPAYGKFGDEPPDPNANKSILQLRRLNRDLEPEGKTLKFPGSFLIGVHDSIAYIFQPQDETSGHSHRIEALFPSQFED